MQSTNNHDTGCAKSELSSGLIIFIGIREWILKREGHLDYLELIISL